MRVWHINIYKEKAVNDENSKIPILVKPLEKIST